MQRGLEAPIELTVCNKAKMAGWEHRKVAWMGRRGAADRVFFGFGRCVWIEFKAPGKAVIGQQGREYQKLKALYSEVYVCDSIADGLRILGIDQ